jgi:hypothetical protein
MSSEHQFPYDGPLSTFTEWDALLCGIATGIVLNHTSISRDIAREPSKFIGGVFTGWVIARYAGGD